VSKAGFRQVLDNVLDQLVCGIYVQACLSKSLAPEDLRAAWEEAGVVCDPVSSRVLVLNPVLRGARQPAA